jgi:hypothetical protein
VLTPHPSAEVDNRTLRQINQDRRIEQTARIINDAETRNEPLGSHLLLERPEHIAVAYLIAAGRTREETSQVTGISLQTINNIARQPWFRDRLKQITESAGTDMVKAFLQGEVLPSLEVLRAVRDNPDERGATRVSAANSILDRFMGKPTVHVESKTNLNIHSAADAKDQVQSELEKVDAELRRLGVSSSNPRAN